MVSHPLRRSPVHTPSSPDPVSVWLSTAVYRGLLAFYPPAFRRDYAAPMLQLFRDCCLQTRRNSGLPGLLALWARTLLDWVRSVVDDQLHRPVEITLHPFIRLGGWSMILGALLLPLGSGIDSNAVYVALQRWFGPPVRLEGYIIYHAIADHLASGVLLASILLLVAGFAGCSLRYGSHAGPVGRLGLAGSITGGAITGGTLVFRFLRPDTDPWYVLLVGFLILFGGLLLFGMAALRRSSLPSRPPLLSGVGFPAYAALMTLVNSLAGTTWQPPAVANFVILISTVAGLVMLGYRLQKM